MVVLFDEKDIAVSHSIPPPPYVSHDEVESDFATRNNATASSSRMYSYRTLTSLPSHVLLHIVEYTLPSRDAARDNEEHARRTTRTLYWIASCLRLTCRGVYLASMHILRSAYLPAYTRHVRFPYTSDPFPYCADSANALTNEKAPILSMQHETEILDLFILLSLRESVFADDSMLYNSDTETFRDLFAFMQPRARLEDLLRDFGSKAGLVINESSSRSSTTSASTGHSRTRIHPNALPFSSLSIQLTPTHAKLLFSSSARRKRVIVEARRARGETLERTVSQLIYELKIWTDESVLR